MLELRSVSKFYGSRQVLAPLDLVLEAGRTTVLIGPSGSGKSTLLRMMMGLIPSDTGEVVFDGEILTPSNALLLRQRIGYVLQEGGLFPHYTARENIELMARYLGWENNRLHQRTEELAALTRFPADGLSRYPDALSGGQRQRVSLMRALMLDPEVLLMDEPLGALDPMIRAELQEDLRSIFQRLKKTVVIVTHDLGEAAFFGDIILLMREGHIIQQGTIRQLVSSPAEPFVEKFVRAQRPFDFTHPQE